ncbi:MAG: NAD-dependent epimerase/dehydratase family protein [Micropruina sp.]|uniref:NAD-dependent epimerase/dehydratase family protein n=1 Tax=Dietzia sp. UBA5065 TaxID=1946422 RepID=UPI0025B805B4|nr:NAD-dependent epimerase/dehydratase family protein [Dietzia sp. UBA5065]MBK9157396.1 NAD-dependent epimerase/dehydratase family protein [Micropruina sp.]
MYHLVLGAGPVGRQTAQILAGNGERVVLASRSGAGPTLAGVERRALDAGDATVVTEAATGAVALYNCLNPVHYHRWDTEWPPLANAALAAAERSGAVLVTTSNLYAYGRPSGPMVEGQPDAATDVKGRVRAEMWAAALAAHQAGRVRAVEVRAADYLGPGVGGGGVVTRLVPTLATGGKATSIGDLDQPRTWTDVRDVARTLVAAATNPDAHGRVWHVPSNDVRTQRQVLTELAAQVGNNAPSLGAYSPTTMAILGLFIPVLREMRAIEWQFNAPWIMDSTAAQRAFGLAPTPWKDVVRESALA